MAKISVIIPVYKVERYIERCLTSVINQTFNDYTILLIDDCGNDNSISLATRFLNAQNPKISYQVITHSYNQGLSAARNTGIKHSNSEYIYFLDGDDAIAPNCFEIMMNAIDCDKKMDMVIGGIVREDGKIHHISSYLPSTTIVSNQLIIKAFAKKMIVWNAVNRLIRKSFFDKYHIFFTVGITSEDLLWNFETLPFLNKIGIIKDSTYIYFSNEESIMTSASRNHKFALDFLEIIRRMKKAVDKHPTKDYIRYYLSIKYRFVPFVILWHNFPKQLYQNIYTDILNNRFNDYYKFLPLKYKILYFLPVKSIIWLRNFCYIASNYYDAIKYKFMKL